MDPIYYTLDTDESSKLSEFNNAQYWDQNYRFHGVTPSLSINALKAVSIAPPFIAFFFECFFCLSSSISVSLDASVEAFGSVYHWPILPNASCRVYQDLCLSSLSGLPYQHKLLLYRSTESRSRWIGYGQAYQSATLSTAASVVRITWICHTLGRLLVPGSRDSIINLSPSVGAMRSFGLPAMIISMKVIESKQVEWHVPSSHDSRTAASPDDSPFSTPPLGTVTSHVGHKRRGKTN